MSRRIAGLSLMGFLLALALGLMVPSVRGEPEVLTIAPTELGLVWVNSAEDVRDAARIQRGTDAGAKLDRLVLYWSNVEGSPGQFNWSNQDRALRDNEARGLGTLAVLLGVPWHAMSGPIEAGKESTLPPVGGGPLRFEGAGALDAEACGDQRPPRGLNDPIFADGTDTPGPGKVANPNNLWARFVQQAVNRYRPGGTGGTNVHYWEIWNEPDLCQFWLGTPQEYARLLKVAYLLIKQSDPGATVMWAGLAHPGNNTQFLPSMVTALRTDPMAAAHNGFFDAAASHQYSDVLHGYNFTNRIRSALAGTGWEGKPIWITESGVPVCDSFPGPECPSPHRATADGQAAYVWQNIAYTRLANNGGPIFHFQLHDDCGNMPTPNPPADAFGLATNEAHVFCVPHTAQPRLSYSAYQQAARYLADTELLWADIQGGVVRRFAFYHPATGERRLLTWSIDGSSHVAQIPAAGVSARRIALDGSEMMLTPVNGEYRVDVPGSTNLRHPGSATFIGGKPYMLVERDTLPPTMHLDELPPLTTSPFPLSWRVEDKGSGVAWVNLWVQRDEGPWQMWLAGQPATGTASFTGEREHRYRFLIQSADRAGNVYGGFDPLAETMVTDRAPLVRLSGNVLTMEGEPASWAPVQIGGAVTMADATGTFMVPATMGRWNVSVQGKVLRYGQLFLDDTAMTLLLPPAHNPVANGDFEAGLTGWTTSGSSPIAVEPFSSTLSDKLLHLATAFVPAAGVPGTGGSAGGNSTVSTRVQVPSGHPQLALIYTVESAEIGGIGACSNPSLLHDKFEIIVARDGSPAHYVHCQESASPWGYRFLDLSAYAGETVTLIFNVYESSPTLRTSAMIDLVTVGESPVLPEPHRLFVPITGD